jgi:hypothetical protein
VAGRHGASAAAVHRIAGRPYTECEQVYSAGQKRNLKLTQKTRNGTINRGDKSQCTKSESVRGWGRCPLSVFKQRCDGARKWVLTPSSLSLQVCLCSNAVSMCMSANVCAGIFSVCACITLTRQYTPKNSKNRKVGMCIMMMYSLRLFLACFWLVCVDMGCYEP